MRAALILAFARVIRRPMAVSCTRKARAISGTVRPATMRSVSATRASNRQRRVTAGEDQPEPVVVDGAGRLGRVVVVRHLSLPVLVVALVLAPDPVDGLAVGGGGQPGAGVGRYAVGRPPLDGGRERLGRRLLGDVEVTETPGQGGDHPRPLLVVGQGDRLPDVDQAHRNGRTSTFRLQAFDPSPAKTQWPAARSPSL